MLQPTSPSPGQGEGRERVLTQQGLAGAGDSGKWSRGFHNHAAHTLNKDPLFCSTPVQQGERSEAVRPQAARQNNRRSDYVLSVVESDGVESFAAEEDAGGPEARAHCGEQFLLRARPEPFTIT